MEHRRVGGVFLFAIMWAEITAASVSLCVVFCLYIQDIQDKVIGIPQHFCCSYPLARKSNPALHLKLITKSILAGHSIPIMLHNDANFSFLPLFLFLNCVINNANCSETTLISFFVTDVFLLMERKLVYL